MNHEIAAPMIGDLLHGRLSGETRDDVLSHVTACEECRSLSETYGLLSEALIDDTVEHPSAEAIVHYAFTEDELDPEERDRIATHLLGLAVGHPTFQASTKRPRYPFQTLAGSERRVVPSEPSKRSVEPPQIFTSAALRHRAGRCR